MSCWTLGGGSWHIDREWYHSFHLWNANEIVSSLRKGLSYVCPDTRWGGLAPGEGHRFAAYRAMLKRLVRWGLKIPSATLLLPEMSHFMPLSLNFLWNQAINRTQPRAGGCVFYRRCHVCSPWWAHCNCPLKASDCCFDFSCALA